MALEFFVEFNEWADKKIKGYESSNGWLLAFDGRLISVSSDLSTSYHEFWAVGSGREYARPAMHLGHDVRAHCSSPASSPCSAPNPCTSTS